MRTIPYGGGKFHFLQGARHWTTRPFLITRRSPTVFSFEGHASSFMAQLVVMHDRS